MKNSEIEAQGWREVRQPGKLRFVKPLTKKARRVLCPPNDKDDSPPVGG